MNNVGCFKPLQGATFRVTRVDECGTPIFDECAYAVSDGQTQIEITPNTTDGQQFQQLNAAGVAIVNQQAKTILNWFDYQIIMAVKDPELFWIMTGATRFLDYTTPTAKVAGNIITADNYATGNLALEVWLGTSQEACPTPPAVAAPWYGYILLPFTEDGKLTESITIANDLITYTFAGRTRTGTPWGAGPYNVMLDAAGLPAPLPSAIPTNTHYLDLFTQLPPPEPECGCLELES
jgi:hypothetical protein